MIRPCALIDGHGACDEVAPFHSDDGGDGDDVYVYVGIGLLRWMVGVKLLLNWRNSGRPNLAD